MVSFSHTDAGTAEAGWIAAGVDMLPELPLDNDELAARAFLVLAAHPDDETLGAGGLLGRLADLGVEHHVVLCTAGEASHPKSPTFSGDALGQLRLREFQDGLDVAGVGGYWTFLALPDGGLSGRRQRIVEAIQEALARFDLSREIVLVAPLRSDGHTDHDVLGEVAAELAEAHGYELLEYPIWYWHWAEPSDHQWRNWLRLSLDPREKTGKDTALREHASQTAPLSDQPGDEVLLPEHFLEHFDRAWETFAWTPSGKGGNSSSDAERLFDSVHRSSTDPWGYASSWYEERKRALTLAILPEPKYSSALEIGCSTGILARELVARCAELLCIDASGEAIDAARATLRGLPHVRTAQMTIPAQWPAGRFELIVMSEMGYYLAAKELETSLVKIRESLLLGGTFAMCHWRHPVSGWPLDGDAVHAIARRTLRWPTLALHREKDFVLEIFKSPGPHSETQ